jgi:hemerythrin superfamily protein
MIEKAKSGSEKLALAKELEDALAGHATIEEQIFYPGVMVKDTEDILREAVEEHLAVKRVIADILEIAPTDSSFDAKMKVLKEQVSHHVEEEEGELFPRVKKVFSDDALEDMGGQMEALFAEVSEGEPREEVPAETREPAPLPDPR